MTDVAAARFQRSAQRLIKHFAASHTVTLRRHSTLSDRSTGGAPSLLVDGLTSADSGTIDLDATYLSGILAAGTIFTIDGDATEYTVQADVEASSNALVGVAIDPPLAQNAANNAAVTITSTYADVSARAAVSRFADELIDNSRIKATDRQVVLDLLDLSITVDISTEVVIDSRVYQIKEIMPVSPGLENYAMRLHVGSK